MSIITSLYKSQLFENILYEYKTQHVTYELVLLTHLSTLYMYIFRAQTKSNTSKQYDISDILTYIASNYTKKLTLEEISNKFFYNSSYLSRLIKEKTGNTFSDYIQKIRITKACELLNDNKSIPIPDIATIVGYKSNNLFYEHFKKHIGMSPQKYKQKYSNSKEPHETLL